MLNRLREATTLLHEQIEKDNLAGKILDQSISFQEYKCLLSQNFLAYKIVESEIAPFAPDKVDFKYRSLEKDLVNLQVPIPHIANTNLRFSCSNLAESLGAEYVVEGSALGGVLISKELRRCPFYTRMQPPEFFNGDPEKMKSWRNFLKKVKSSNFSEAEISDAVNKAKETFILFGKILQKEEEPI